MHTGEGNCYLVGEHLALTPPSLFKQRQLPALTAALDQARCGGVDQHREHIPGSYILNRHQYRPFAFDTTAQHSPKTEQGSAAANFASVARTIADHFAVRTQHGIHEMHRIQT